MVGTQNHFEQFQLTTMKLRRRVPLFAAMMLLIAHYLVLAPIPQSSSSPSYSDTNAHFSPDYEVVTTKYGWTLPTAERFSFSRRIVSGEFFRAVLAHPEYNASAWTDLESNPNPDRRIVAFLDLDTCVETNYPVYAPSNWRETSLEADYPSRTKSAMAVVADSCSYLTRAADSPALTANPDSRLVVLDCAGVDRFRIQSVCKDTGIFDRGQVIVGHYSLHRDSARSLLDVGVPPPAIKPVHLTLSQRRAIKNCEPRTYLFSFQGQGGFGRNNLLALQNETNFFVRVFRSRDGYKDDIRKDGLGDGEDGTVNDINHFKRAMTDSVFAGAPRGDLLFSYRFSEVLSAGSVPVVYADGWLPPYNEHVINWSECAVFIAESNYHKTADILHAIPRGTRCQMQQCVLAVWDNYVSSRDGWVRGLVEVALSSDE